MTKAEESLASMVNRRVIVFGEIHVDEGSKTVFEPWMDQARTVFGLSATPPVDIGPGTTYIYVVPDLDTKPGEGPRFHLYIGPHGDPGRDTRLGPYYLEGRHDE